MYVQRTTSYAARLDEIGNRPNFWIESLSNSAESKQFLPRIRCCPDVRGHEVPDFIHLHKNVPGSPSTHRFLRNSFYLFLSPLKTDTVICNI
jgi:hypothetical protein